MCGHIYVCTAAAAAKSLQSCSTLCDPIDGSLPGSLVPGILQARTPEWVAISFSNAWKWKVKVKSLSRVRLLVTPWTAACQAHPSIGFSRQEYWSGVPLRCLYVCTHISIYCCCSVTMSYLTFHDLMDCSTPGLPVPHHLLEFAQVNVHCISDAKQPSHLLSPYSPSAFNLSKGLFQWVSCSHQVVSLGASTLASVLPMSIQGFL